MEDLAAAVQSILNDPQSMAQLQSVMNSLGMNPPQAPAPAPPPCLLYTSDAADD